jgi:hypothetical protein
VSDKLLSSQIVLDGSLGFFIRQLNVTEISSSLHELQNSFFLVRCAFLSGRLMAGMCHDLAEI